MRGLSGTFSSQMMLPWLFTQNEPCNVSLPASQMLPSSSPGVEVSFNKMEVLYQPAPREVYHPPHITIGKTELKSVQHFSYLGCIISSDARIDKEVDNSLAKASSAFGRLYKGVWNNKNLKIQTQITVYRTVVLIYPSHVLLLERFHQRCLHTILSIHWSEINHECRGL